MRQGEIWLLEPPFEKVRPVIVISRDWAIANLNNVVVVPITTTIRTEQTIISVGPEYGLRYDSAATFDNLTSVPKSQLTHQIGALENVGREQLCAAFRNVAGC